MLSPCVHHLGNETLEEPPVYLEHCLDSINVITDIKNSSSLEVTKSDYRIPNFPEELLQVNMTNLIAYSILFPMAAVGNLMVLNALFNSRRCKSRINLMILNLSLADMIVTFVFLPIEMIWHITIQWPFGEIGCKIHKFFSAFGFYTSSMILVCISLDRYFAVLHPLKVNDAQRRGKIMLFFAWIISAYISLPQTIMFSVQSHPYRPSFIQCVSFGFFEGMPSAKMLYTVLCIFFLYFLPLAIILIAYTRIIMEISKKSKETQDELSSKAPPHQQCARLHLRRSNVSSLERARTRTLRMTFIIVIAFIWCWTPYALGTLWNFIDKSSFENMNKPLQDVIFLLAVSNSVVNPLVYGRYIIPCCRHFARRKLPRQCRQTSQQLQRLTSIGCNDGLTREDSPPLDPMTRPLALSTGAAASFTRSSWYAAVSLWTSVRNHQTRPFVQRLHHNTRNRSGLAVSVVLGNATQQPTRKRNSWANLYFIYQEKHILLL
ncbi:G protein-coupled receptor rhodopsin-like [Trinorchestia longiramus]|nr:G protein-coupled receptor rhodopsin-like [Trinorchestia longiramus]